MYRLAPVTKKNIGIFSKQMALQHEVNNDRHISYYYSSFESLNKNKHDLKNNPHNEPDLHFKDTFNKKIAKSPWKFENLKNDVSSYTF